MSIAIPKEFYRSKVDHSGLVFSQGSMVHNETIDSNHWGHVCLILFNFSNKEYVFEKHKRIGQLIIERYYTPKFVEVHNFTDGKTERGDGGFGSSGFWFFFVLYFIAFNNLM